jgi:hypothetical protein
VKQIASQMPYAPEGATGIGVVILHEVISSRTTEGDTPAASGEL